MILWGPPGTGKTTLARLIAHTTGANFQALSAVSAGVADLRRVVADAAKLKRAGKRSVLFIDEIHRFNKAQQDAVLPYVEDGTVTLIGATTENPSFEVNSALLSRSRVFVLAALGDDDIRTIVERALDGSPSADSARRSVAIDARRARRAGQLANGDARVALEHARVRGRGRAAATPTARASIDPQTIADALQKRARTYDAGRRRALRHDQRVHQDDARQRSRRRGVLSRADDRERRGPAVHRAPARDPGQRRHRPRRSARAPAAVAAQQSVHFIGMPEGFYPLAQATLYLATAPKSNAVGRAYGAALADVQATRNDPVPLHLRNAPTRADEAHGVRQRLSLRARRLRGDGGRR